MQVARWVQLDPEKLETLNENQSKLMFFLDYLNPALRNKEISKLYVSLRTAKFPLGVRLK